MESVGAENQTLGQSRIPPLYQHQRSRLASLPPHQMSPRFNCDPINKTLLLLFRKKSLVRASISQPHKPQRDSARESITSAIATETRNAGEKCQTRRLSQNTTDNRMATSTAKGRPGCPQVPISRPETLPPLCLALELQSPRSTHRLRFDSRINQWPKSYQCPILILLRTFES